MINSLSAGVRVVWPRVAWTVGGHIFQGLGKGAQQQEGQKVLEPTIHSGMRIVIGAEDHSSGFAPHPALPWGPHTGAANHQRGQRCTDPTMWLATLRRAFIWKVKMMMCSEEVLGCKM